MNTSFNDLGLSEALLTAVEKLGYAEPTPVQAQAIPLALAGKDVVAAAKTGTGKTAAFALPTLERIEARREERAPAALVVTPTRELAQQIDQFCFAASHETKHRVLTVVGGVSYNPQLKSLKRGVDVLIATPGRLIDLMERGAVDLSHVETLILDEADRMLDIGFWPDMEKIVAATPETRQTMLFSATIDRKIMKTIEYALKDPEFVEIAHRGETADTVDQHVVMIAHRKKPGLLKDVLSRRGCMRTIIFARTKGACDEVAEDLRRAGFRAEAIHSDLSQSKRQRALKQFTQNRIGILVATDVLARGIDVADVEHVINYDLPDCSEDYVHRIGRTGRAGKTGDALSFVSPKARSNLKGIERLIGQKIPVMEIEEIMALEIQPEPQYNEEPERPARSGKPRRHRGERPRHGGRRPAPFDEAQGERSEGEHRGRKGKRPYSGKKARIHPAERRIRDKENKARKHGDVSDFGKRKSKRAHSER